MLFYVNDWLSSTAVCAMSLDEAGGYFNLICHCWASGDASLPDDDAKLAGLSRLGRKWSRGSGATIRECLAPHPDKPGFLTIEKTLAVWRDRKNYVDRCSDAGRKSGETRRGRTKVSSTNLRTRHEQERQQDIQQGTEQGTEQDREQESNSSFSSSIGILTPPPNGSDCAGGEWAPGWAAVAEELLSEEFGVRTAADLIPGMVFRGWTPAGAKALCDWWQNHQAAEEWPVSWLVRVFQGPPVSPEAGLPLRKSGKPVDVRGDYEARQAAQRRDEDARRRQMAIDAETAAQQRLERLGPLIDAMTVDERQRLVSDKGPWFSQQAMVRGDDWRGAKLLRDALLWATEQQTPAGV